MSRISEKRVESEIKDGYRELDRWSYSYLKDYISNRIGFYMKYILKDEEYIKKDEQKKKDSPDIKMGNLIDVLRTAPELYDSLYYESTLTNIPDSKTQPYIFTNIAANIASAFKEPLGKEHLETAYEELKKFLNKDKLGTGVDKFIENFKRDNLQYYIELVNSAGKTVISKEEYEAATKSSDKAKYAPNFKDDGDVYTKFPILFEYDDVPFKCEIDKFVVNHKEKRIYLYDYKKAYNIEEFIWLGYLKMYYYIQQGLYTWAMRDWAEKNFKGYRVQPLAFRVIDSTGNFDPLVYECTENQYFNAFSGFYVGNKYYVGIDQIIEDINESIKLDKWGMSAYNLKNNGVVKIPEFRNSLDE